MTPRTESPAGQGGAREINANPVNTSNITRRTPKQDRLRFGQCQGRTFWWLILRRPECVARLLRTELTGPALEVLEEAILAFDDARILEKCGWNGCVNQAARCTAYKGLPPNVVDLECSDHTAMTFGNGRPIDSYRAALAYAKECGGGTTWAYREIITRLAEAKGIPLPVQRAAA